MLVQKLFVFVLQVVTLYSLSRILFVWVLQAVATRGRAGGWLVNLCRLPGNLIHEVGHAIGYRLSGYRVKSIVSCMHDERGRGRCVPGEAWSPIALPWVATATASVFPLVFGTVVLWGWANALGISLDTSASHDEGALLYFWDTVRDTLLGLDVHSWRTWAFLYLAFSIGAELAPSDADLRRGLFPLLLLAGLVAVAGLWFGTNHPETAAWSFLYRAIVGALTWLSPLLTFGIMTTGLVAVVTVIPAMALRGLRRLLDV